MILIPNGEMYSGALTIRGAGALRRMNLKFSIGYDSDVTKAKELTKDALDSLHFIVDEPPPKVFVTELSSEGVNITVNFWINTDKSRPREAFDAAAVEIMRILDDQGIELFPPDSLIVQRAAEADAGNGEASSARSTA